MNDGKPWLGLLFVGMIAGYLLLERFVPARSYPPQRGWRARQLLVFAGCLGVSAVVPLLIPHDWLRANRLIDGESLGIVGGVVVGHLLLTFLTYWYHRLEHEVGWLWRLHQLHHSPRAMDSLVGFYFHPLDFAFYVLVRLAATMWILGLHPVAASVLGVYITFSALFTHCNLRTPRWVGWVQQRPEAHLLHHEAGVHAGNYNPFPLWDRLFGTYREAQDVYQGEIGLAGGHRFWAMLAGVEISPRANAPEGGAAAADLEADRPA